MPAELINFISSSPILQGALGSALFWILLTIIQFITRLLSHTTKVSIKQTVLENRLREYIYRKYTSRDGLSYYTQGYFFSFNEALTHIVKGCLFVVIALLISGTSQIAFGICLVSSGYFFIKALKWLESDPGWDKGSLSEHWRKVGELENQLFGSINEDTKERIKKWTEKEIEDSEKNV